MRFRRLFTRTFRDFFAAMMKKNLFGFLFLLFTLACASPVFAQNDDLTARERLTTARGLGLANAMSASAGGTAAVWHNPAAITQAFMYSIEAAYRFGNNNGTHGFQVDLLDMKSNEYVGAEIGYDYEYSKPNDKSQHFNHVRLGLAVPLANNMVSIGVTGVYSNIKYDGDTALSQFTMDVGLMIKPLSWLSLSFAAQNLIVGDYAYIMPRMYTAGIAFSSLEYGIGVMFDASFNGSADDIKNTGSYAVGVEYLLIGEFPLRLGYRYEAPDALHVIAAGAGYRDKGGKLGLDISYQHHFEPIENDILNVSLGLYF